jgi:hypothetical protein
MENTDRGVQGRTDETEIAEPVATCLEFPRKVRMSHICKVEVSHFPVEQAGLECGRGTGDHERARTEPH